MVMILFGFDYSVFTELLSFSHPAHAWAAHRQSVCSDTVYATNLPFF